MRRVYFPVKGRDKFKPAVREALEKEVLSLMRELRETIDPKVVEGVRRVIGDSVGANEKKSPKQPVPAFVTGKTFRDDMIPVDRKKNMSIIVKYIHENPHNKDAMRELSALLDEER